MPRRFLTGGRLLSGLLATALVLPAPAAAQRAGGPFSGLFGRTPPRTGQEVTRVEIRGAIGGQHDSTIPAGVDDVNGLPTGAIASASTGLVFERHRDRLEVRGKGSATHQEFFREPRTGAPTYEAAANMLARIGTRFTIDGNAQAIRSPFFHVSLVAPLPIPFLDVSVPGDRNAIGKMRNDTFDGAIGFTSQFTERSRFSASVSRRDIRFLEQPYRDYAGWGSRADLRRRLSRNSTLRLSYGREQAHQNLLGDGLYVHELLDAGVDLDRGLSITRRTSLSFYTQTSILRETGGPRRFRLNGGLTLGRDLRRTWNAAITVNRDTELHPGFVAPLFSHGLAFSVGGMPTLRTEFTANVSARRGHLGFDGSNKMNTQSATARLSTGITTKTGLYGQYTYYRYDVPAGSTVVEMLPRLARQQFAIGVTLWLPIYTHVRAPRDPR
jgi:hypothetical protein